MAIDNHFLGWVDWAWRTNRKTSARYRSNYMWFCFMGLAQTGSLLIKRKNTCWSWTTNSKDLCHRYDWLLNEKCRVCVFHVAEVCIKYWGRCWDVTLMILHGCCSNMIFRLWFAATERHEFTSSCNKTNKSACIQYVFYHMCVHLLILLRGFVKSFKARIRNVNVLYSQSVCVCVWAVCCILI